MFQEHSYLYVEDDPFSCQVMQMIMENAMQVKHLHIFQDSSNFVERVKALEKQPDIILLDVHIKPLDGFEMLRLLRADPDLSQVRIIALTASVMSEEVDQLKQGGFDGAIAKPVSVTTFPGLMQRIIAGETVWHIA